MTKARQHLTSSQDVLRKQKIILITVLSTVAGMVKGGIVKKKERKRRWWVRPYLRKRGQVATYTSLYRELIQVCLHGFGCLG